MTPTPTPPEQPEDDRCPSKRVVLLGEYASTDLRCQKRVGGHTTHRMATESDGVTIVYAWSD